ncbi:transglutaminase domain-containing protein [Gorillibacterium sp. CAU 1737]|uniref:transglutaminase domain-containing protein n=1 Tax=Gorillibacterium sp. CAU 1737 TaxID=3140362 RepID=UPI0032604FEE
MKRLSALTLAVLMTVMAVLPSRITAAATSYFSHNPALGSLFQQLEKQFLKFPNDEVVPLASYGIIGDASKNTIPRTVKKISEQQRKDAATRKLNEIRTEIEIKEERLGGFSAQEYKQIADHLTQQMQLAAGSEFGWNKEGTKVIFHLDVDLDGFYRFPGLVGNFARMGKEKDQVSQADLLVKSKVDRYLNQAIQKGNKIGADVLKRLPGEVEKVLVEQQPSKIVTYRLLASLHDDIFNPEDKPQYDGSKSVEDLIDSFVVSVKMEVRNREAQMKQEYYEYPADAPTADFNTYITKLILNEELSDSFTSGFTKTITLDELARLYFENKEISEKIVIEDPAVPADSPDWIKQAYIYGMLDDVKSLSKPLTRLEASRYLIDGVIYSKGSMDWLPITDAGKIPIADQEAVAVNLSAGMGTRNDKFEPQAGYMKQEAIRDRQFFSFTSLRGYNIRYSERTVSQVRLGKDSIHLLFEDKEALNEYIKRYLDSTVLGKIKPNGTYTKVDTGGAVIELFTPENGVKVTMKSGVTFFDLEQGRYGPGTMYLIEPKVIKATDKPNMTLQPDSFYQKLNPRLDAVLKKIIKPNMTDTQKVKAIHDYIITNVTYKPNAEVTVDNVLTPLQKDKGVTGNTALLFVHLCKRASVPCVYESSQMMNHAWNSVYLNGQWLFVDVTWDSGSNGKVQYTYFLKDRFFFMGLSSHDPIMGVPKPELFKNLDPMKLKSQDEIRAYLLRNFYWTDGFKLSFRVADKSLKPIIPYMKDNYVTVKLTYDAKTDLYTVTAKKK